MFGGGYGPNASINENKEHALNGMIIRMIKSTRDNKKNLLFGGQESLSENGYTLKIWQKL